MSGADTDDQRQSLVEAIGPMEAPPDSDQTHDSFQEWLLTHYFLYVDNIDRYTCFTQNY